MDPQLPGQRHQVLRLCHRQVFDPSALLRAGLRLPNVTTFKLALARAKRQAGSRIESNKLIQRPQHARMLHTGLTQR